LQNLVVPENHYKEEIKKINEQLAKSKLDDKKTAKEIERLTNITTKLTKAMQSELEQQLVKKEQTLKHLSELLPKLFSQMKSQTQQDMCN